MPANVAYQMIKVLADALPVGPILIGPARPAHILTPSVTARGASQHDGGRRGRGAGAQRAHSGPDLVAAAPQRVRALPI